MTKASHAREDLVGCLRPHKGLRADVGQFDIVSDGGFQLARASMHASAQLLLGQRRKPPLHQIDPGTACGREVDVEARVPANQRWMRGVLWVLALSTIRWTSRVAGTVAAMVSRNVLSLRFNPSRCSEDRLRPFVKRTGP